MRVFSIHPVILWAVLAVIVAFSFGFILVSGESPEKTIPGQWKETEWTYEKLPTNIKDNSYKSISESIKREIMETLVIHEAETWSFSNRGTLDLTGKSVVEPSIKWKIKGRGNILVLTHVDGREEHYNIKRLSKEEMIIHFESDLQAKGIVKITLKRVNSDVDDNERK